MYPFWLAFWKRELKRLHFLPFANPLFILSLFVCPTLSEWVLMLQSLNVMHRSVKDQVVNTTIWDCISGTGLSFTVLLEWHNWCTQHRHPHLDTHTHTWTTHTHTHTWTHTNTVIHHGLPWTPFRHPHSLLHYWKCAILIKIKDNILWIWMSLLAD